MECMVAGEDEVLPVTVSAVAAWHIPSVSRADQAMEDTMSLDLLSAGKCLVPTSSLLGF